MRQLLLAVLALLAVPYAHGQVNYSSPANTGILPMSHLGPANFAEFQSQIASCASIPCSMFVAGNIVVPSNYTVPANVVLTSSGGQLQPAAGVTVTVAAIPNAPMVQIFGGAGTIVGLPLARPEWFPGGTVAAAISSLAFGGHVLLAANNYPTGTVVGAPLVASNFTMDGVGQATYNSGNTGFTQFSGSVLQGALVLKGSNIRISNFSVDNGSALGTCTDGVTISSGGISQPLLHDVVIDHVSTLLCTSTSAYHSILCEGVVRCAISNVQTINGVYGVVLKCQHCTATHVVSAAHSSNCFLVKSDNLFAIAAYVDADDIRCSSLTAGDTGPVQILGAAALAQKITLRNVKATGMNAIGIEVYAFALSGVPGTVADSTIENPIVDTVNGTGIQTVSDASSLITRLAIVNPIVNNTSTAIQLGQYGAGITVANAMLTNVVANGIDNYAANSTFTNTNCSNVAGFCGYSRGNLGEFVGIQVTPAGSGIAAGPAYGSDTGTITYSTNGNFLAGSAPTVNTSSVYEGVSYVTVGSLSTATPFPGSGQGSGLLRLRDNTLGGGALFLLDPNGGVQLIGTSQIAGITAATAITQVSGSWCVTLSSGAVPRNIGWTFYE